MMTGVETKQTLTLADLKAPKGGERTFAPDFRAL
jgi:hypothetical protein